MPSAAWKARARHVRSGVVFQSSAAPSLCAPGQGRLTSPIHPAAFAAMQKAMTVPNPLGRWNGKPIAELARVIVTQGRT